MIWLGIVIFFGLHIMPSVPGARDSLIGSLGEKRYKGIYSLIAAIGLVLIGVGYSQMDYQELWATPVWASHLAFAVMPIVFILFVVAELKGHLRLKIKHPMIIGVLLWGLVHLVNNGDRASLYLFGSFALYSVFSIISSNRRGKLPNYTDANGKHDIVAIVVGLIAFGGVLWAHELLFGVAPVF